MQESHDSRANPLPPLVLTTSEHSYGIRVWQASSPIFDNTKNPAHGTVGFHVHVYGADGRKVIDDTYETVTVDGWLL